MNLNITLSHAVPEEPGVYLVFFLLTKTYDVVTLIRRQSILAPHTFYLCAANRGGCIDNWKCLWSEELPRPVMPSKTLDYPGMY